MFNVKTSILKLKSLRNLTWDAWGEKCSRSGASIKKLLDEDSNPTVSTLNSILPVVGASLQIITTEEQEILDGYGAMVEKLQALETLREIQTARIATFDEENRKKDERIADLIQTIKKQQETIETFMRRMERRENAADRKDAALHQLLVEKGVLNE